MLRRRYYRLTLHEREHLNRLLGTGASTRSLARCLGRAPSSVARELRRLGPTRAYYWPTEAQAHAGAQSWSRSHRPLLDRDPRLRAYVLAGLRRRWSPEQIVIRLRAEYPQDKTMRISHETIYRYLYVMPRGQLKAELLRCLRRRRRYRQHRGATYTRRQLVEPKLIDHRPTEVDDRTIPGHWEGDLLLGAARCPAAVGTLVERTTRFTVLVPVAQRRDAAAVCKAFARRMRRVPTPLRKTLTTDQGFEFAAHRTLTDQASVQVYFCHPHSPWERGTCENTNGLLRQFFPKGCDFTKISAAQVQHVQNLLNHRPRKSLAGRTPKEVFYGLPIQPLLR